MAERLDERAAQLRGWTLVGYEWRGATGEHAADQGEWRPSRDLNDAAELFLAAPVAVQHDIANRAQHVSNWLGWMLDTLDPAALTRAVVTAWEAARTPAATHSKGPETPSNAKGGGNGDE